MSADTVISVENLSKRYLVGHEGSTERYHSLRDSIVRHGKNFTRKTFDMLLGRQIVQGDDVEEFWALKDVSFEVKRGEVVGIIGRNGAGKSTLLKILSRITEPTEGRITLRGRVASLLEVGTGFHPELTGRENVFLNGAILGMTRTEIRQKFDEIVAFAEITKFIDTPVKRYSSGMYVRLAFAVAAHLEPEILIVDEVLAVGDAEFQKKCMGKLQNVASEGRTILFVSHNLAAVRRLCGHALLISGGRVANFGKTNEVTDVYQQAMFAASPCANLKDRKDRTGSGRIQITEFSILTIEGSKLIRSGDDVDFFICFEARDELVGFGDLIASIGLSSDEQFDWLVRSNFDSQNLHVVTKRGQIRCRVHNFALAEARYRVTLFLSNGDHETLDLLQNATTIVVHEGDFFGTKHPGIPQICKTLTRAAWDLFPDELPVSSTD